MSRVGMRADHRRRAAPLVVAIALLGLALAAAGCGGSAASSAGPARAGGGDGAVAPLPQASAAASAADKGNGLGELPGGEPGGAPAAPADGLKIVYTGSLQLVVADLPATLEKARVAVAAVGGYVGASQASNADDKPVATITYRIPATRWSEALDRIRGLATKVASEQTQATEVGSQIVDLDARIRNLRASETSLQAIARGAAKVTDLLEVERQLTDVRGQIEQLDAQRTRLADQVAYGTLVTTFGLELVAVEHAAQAWDPAKDVDSASATLIGIGQALVTAAIWLGIVWLPFLLVLAVAFLVARALWRRFRPRPTPRPPSDPIPGWQAG